MPHFANLFQPVFLHSSRYSCFSLIRFSLTAFLFASFSIASRATDLRPSNLQLWYDEPAHYWEEALPLGNGRLGAMVYGGVEEEIIALNEDSFWAGGPHNNLNPKARQALPEIRRLLAAGEYTTASKLAEESITSPTAQGMPYLSAGELRLHFSSEGGSGQASRAGVDDYRRDLDLSSALASTRFRLRDVVYQREVFSSLADNVIVVGLSASKKKALSFSVELLRPGAEVLIDAQAGRINMGAKGRDHEGVKGRVRLGAALEVLQQDGRVSAVGNTLRVDGASQVVILLSLATNVRSYQDVSADAEALATDYLNAALAHFRPSQGVSLAARFAERKAAHSRKHAHFFGRVSLDLGGDDFSHETTDQRLQAFSQRRDSSLVSLYFQFGRYLLIAASQPGSEAANLQGIWNQLDHPPWDAKYTLNINAEMNYWPAESANLSELHEPLLRLIRELAQQGREGARIMYGAGGWVAHHNTDLWRSSGAVDRAWGAWPTSNAWLVQHLWQHYLYTGDEKYLQTVYPIMVGACEFFADFLQQDKAHGWLLVSPSMSPENSPQATGVKIAAGVSMDSQLLFDLFTNTMAAAEILQRDEAQRLGWQAILDRLPPLQIGRHHQLQEWLQDWDDPFDHHRHLSHLYGLFPSNQISPLRTPELFSAAKVSMEQRGDPSTGWSMNWKINLWARLLDGNRALKLIGEQLRAVPPGEGLSESGGSYPNLFDAHPPFQIDGNFGFTSGVTEMLAQSQDAAVFLLPALPAAWPQGAVKGLVMRGGFVVDLQWREGRVTRLKVSSRLGGLLRLRSYAPLPKAHGFDVRPASGENTNPFYAVPKMKAALKHSALNLPQLSLANTYLVDVETEKGQVYEWGSEEI